MVNAANGPQLSHALGLGFVHSAVHSAATTPRTRHLCRLAQKQAPTYGAIPTAADVKKQREGEEEEKVWREEFVYSLLQPDALKRLNQTEQDNATKVLTLPRHVSTAP